MEDSCDFNENSKRKVIPDLNPSKKKSRNDSLNQIPEFLGSPMYDSPNTFEKDSLNIEPRRKFCKHGIISLKVLNVRRIYIFFLNF